MAARKKANAAGLGALARVMDGEHRLERRRQMVADFCRLVGSHLTQPGQTPAVQLVDKLAAEPGLSPRMRQTLACLLAGDAEKQIAPKLGVSPHTVHVYVKSLYKHFAVNSRGELLARFVRL